MTGRVDLRIDREPVIHTIDKYSNKQVVETVLGTVSALTGLSYNLIAVLHTF
jgi:hypothetical protein